MTREDQAGSLGRWLERGPGTIPPEDIDSDVIEAVYALRPDLAPAPRLTADDILASVTRGPLADPTSTGASSDRGSFGAEVVPFPIGGAQQVRALQGRAPQVPEGASDDGARPVRSGRRNVLWMWVGGTGGLGMAMVAAATILLVATPVLRDSARRSEVSGASAPQQGAADPLAAGQEAAGLEAAAPIAADPQTAADPARPMGGEAVADAELGSVTASPAGTAAPRAASPSPVLPSAGTVATREVIEMEGGALFREPSLIPEATERLDLGDAVAVTEAPALEQAAPAAQAPSEQSGVASAKSDAKTEDLDELRARVTTKGSSATSWRKGVDADVLARMDAGIARAETLRAAGNPSAAGDALSAVVQPPARAGQYVATLAARDYLAAGDAQAAAGVAQRGLGLSSAGSPERTALQVAYGDALRAQGDTEGAADVYRQAR